MAYSDKVESFKSGKKEVEYYCGDMYLKKLGIMSTSMSKIDRWVVKQQKVVEHKYDAISECVNFDEVYNECVQLVKSEI